MQYRYRLDGRLTDLFEGSSFSCIPLQKHHRRHFQASGAAAIAIENDEHCSICWMPIQSSSVCKSTAPREEKGPRQSCNSWKPKPPPIRRKGRASVSWFVFVSSSLSLSLSKQKPSKFLGNQNNGDQRLGQSLTKSNAVQDGFYQQIDFDLMGITNRKEKNDERTKSQMA